MSLPRHPKASWVARSGLLDGVETFSALGEHFEPARGRAAPRWTGRRRGGSDPGAAPARGPEDPLMEEREVPEAFYEAVSIVAARYGLEDPDDLDFDRITVEEARLLAFAMEKGRLPQGDLVPTCQDGRCVRPDHVIELGQPPS